MAPQLIFIVSEAAATAIFTITRLLIDSILSVIVLILFSRLNGGSSAKFWYEQTDLVAKISSLFHPFGPTGKRGNKFTNFIALFFTILALALNILPTILSKLSPITTQVAGTVTNSTLAPVNQIFIPTLTDINLPGLTKESTSLNATNKFLCSYIANGCLDSKSNPIAKINWDVVDAQPTQFYHINSDDPTNVLISINDTFGASATAPPQAMFLAKDVFNSNPNLTGIESIGQWSNNSLKGFYVKVLDGDVDDIPTSYNFLHADQIYPLVTPDLALMLEQGRDANGALPTGTQIDRAERWVSVHRNETLSSVLWQTVNAHAGQVGSDWQQTCFICSLMGLTNNASEVARIENSLIAASTKNNTLPFTITSYVDNAYRLTTTLCLLKLNSTSLVYSCLHTYSQLWSISHSGNPYAITGNYNTVTAAELGNLDTPFPIFPPPANVSNQRTYIPIVPIFQVRSKEYCASDWNPLNSTIQAWINDCTFTRMDQVNNTDLDAIAKNVWQLSSTITIGGFLVNATYFNNVVGIAIGTPVIVIVAAAVFFCIAGNILLQMLTSPIHRRSLYEAVRMMVPDSRDPYNAQKVLLDLSPTNTLRMVDSVFDKRISYLKLNNRLLVTLPPEQSLIPGKEAGDDVSTISVNNENLTPTQIQDWSRRQLIKF